jgi:3',5'-cyclic AMP phosphodiesterase CpdA
LWHAGPASVKIGPLRLWAISDLHVGHGDNRRVVQDLPAHPEDWLILGGDLGEKLDHLRFVLEALGPRFAKLVWVPGNHELWAMRGEPAGVARYEAMVALCREYGALTPEDPYPVLEGYLLAPLFTLYDYTFAPEGMDVEAALAWAREARLLCADEGLLLPDPYPTRQAWCEARCAYTERRLEEALASHPGPTVLVNHFPLLEELAVLPRIPRFKIWCGTKRTEDWPRRFRAAVVVSGHLHVPGTRVLRGVRYEEVSLGYPQQWQWNRPEGPYLRLILGSG